MGRFQILKNESDNALVNYANQTNIDDKCGWQSGALDHILRFYNKKTKRIAIDGGASYGFMSNGFAQNFEKVYSFEVNLEVAEMLKLNTSFYKNIEVIDKGLSDTIDDVLLHPQGNATGMVTINNDIGVTPGKVITLDSMNIKDVDLIKLDVEGHEYKAILGALETIKKYKPVLYFEWSTKRNMGDENKRREIFELLDKIGYKFRDHRHYDFLFTI